MIKENEKCPCGSGLDYGLCCGQYISGAKDAPTAEALMRSRYTAYVVHEIDYIMDTCTRSDKEREIDREATEKWSRDSQWMGLKILKTEKGKEEDSEGVVEFTATYSQKGLVDVHHEVAKFVKQAGFWMYDTGHVAPVTVVRDSPKVGRNDPCPCGSGKKYKKCCGA